MKYRFKKYWPIVVSFLVVLVMDIFYISSKTTIHGDEFTSFTLAFNERGWGENAFEVNHNYSAEELRSLLFADNKGGWEGYADDITANHADNRDPSHASLYYMMLRTALLFQSGASLQGAIDCAMGLNLLLSVISFVFMALLLVRIFPKRIVFIAVGLLFAFLSPLVTDSLLLIREAKFAECMFSIFTFCAVVLYDKIKVGEKVFTLKNVLLLSVVVALLFSVGYFNIFYVLLLGGALVYAIMKSYNRKNIGLAVSVAVLSCLFAWLMYGGFFNFMTDVRTDEVVSKLEGNSFMTNILVSGYEGVMMLLKSLGILLPLTVVVVIINFIQKKKYWLVRLPYAWVFVSAALWAVIALLLSPWKYSHYIAAAVPLVTVMLFYYIDLAFKSLPKRIVTVPVLLFILHLVLVGFGKEEQKMMTYNPLPQDEQIYLYATTPEDRNTLSLLAVDMQDNHSCLIFDDVKRIAEFAENGKVCVIADKNMEVLKNAPQFASSMEYNLWQDIYLFE